ncbi:MAG: hypothetical protein R3B55_03055 [Candidatus Paceibacterota bacterium]
MRTGIHQRAFSLGSWGGEVCKLAGQGAEVALLHRRSISSSTFHTNVVPFLCDLVGLLYALLVGFNTSLICWWAGSYFPVRTSDIFASSAETIFGDLLRLLRFAQFTLPYLPVRARYVQGDFAILLMILYIRPFSGSDLPPPFCCPAFWFGLHLRAVWLVVRVKERLVTITKLPPHINISQTKSQGYKNLAFYFILSYNIADSTGSFYVYG